MFIFAPPPKNNIVNIPTIKYIITHRTSSIYSRDIPIPNNPLSLSRRTRQIQSFTIMGLINPWSHGFTVPPLASFLPLSPLRGVAPAHPHHLPPHPFVV